MVWGKVSASVGRRGICCKCADYICRQILHNGKGGAAWKDGSQQLLSEFLPRENPAVL